MVWPGVVQPVYSSDITGSRVRNIPAGQSELGCSLGLWGHWSTGTRYAGPPHVHSLAGCLCCLKRRRRDNNACMRQCVVGVSGVAAWMPACQAGRETKDAHAHSNASARQCVSHATNAQGLTPEEAKGEEGVICLRSWEVAQPSRTRAARLATVCGGRRLWGVPWVPASFLGSSGLAPESCYAGTP